MAKNYLKLSLLGATATKQLLEKSTDRLIDAVSKRLEPEGNRLQAAAANRLEQFQKSKRNWLINEAMTTKVNANKKTGKVSLRIGFSGKFRGTKQFKPSNYAWKIEYGARGGTNRKGLARRYKRKGQLHFVKDTGQRDPRHFIIPAVEETRDEAGKAITDAIHQEIQEIQNDLDKRPATDDTTGN